MQTDNYRKRAGEVRRTARANLLSLRQERLARRATIAGEMTNQSEVDAQTGDAKCEIEVQHRVLEEHEAAHLPHEVDLNSGIDQLDELAIRNAAMSEITEDVLQSSDAAVDKPNHASNGPIQASAAEDSNLSQTDHAKPVENWHESPLAELPGAGPGLIWMLTECQIHSLGDLSQQSAAELSSKLGVVGQIIDVATWIDFAKGKTDAISGS